MDNKVTPFRIVDCNQYDNKSHASIWDMRDIAWVLSTDKQKKFGFKSPKDWKNEREELGIDELPLKPPGIY